jgi:hypothetical protein
MPVRRSVPNRSPKTSADAIAPTTGTSSANGATRRQDARGSASGPSSARESASAGSGGTRLSQAIRFGVSAGPRL